MDRFYFMIVCLPKASPILPPSSRSFARQGAFAVLFVSLYLATSSLTSGADNKSNSVNTLCDLASGGNDFNHRQQALANINKALAQEPNNIRANLIKATLHLDLEEAEEALPCCNKVLKLEPDNEPALNYKARALLHLGKKDEALVCANKALSLHKNPRLSMISVRTISKTETSPQPISNRNISIVLIST